MPALPRFSRKKYLNFSIGLSYNVFEYFIQFITRSRTDI